MANLVVHFEIHASEPQRLIDYYAVSYSAGGSPSSETCRTGRSTPARVRSAWDHPARVPTASYAASRTRAGAGSPRQRLRCRGRRRRSIDEFFQKGLDLGATDRAATGRHAGHRPSRLPARSRRQHLRAHLARCCRTGPTPAWAEPPRVHEAGLRRRDGRDRQGRGELHGIQPVGEPAIWVETREQRLADGGQLGELVGRERVEDGFAHRLDVARGRGDDGVHARLGEAGVGGPPVLGAGEALDQAAGLEGRATTCERRGRVALVRWARAVIRSRRSGASDSIASTKYSK